MDLIKIKEALDCLQNINLTPPHENGKTQVYDTIVNSIDVAVDILNKVTNGNMDEITRCDRCLYFEEGDFAKNEIQMCFWPTDSEIVFADGYCKLHKGKRSKTDFCSNARIKKEAII